MKIRSFRRNGYSSRQATPPSDGALPADPLRKQHVLLLAGASLIAIVSAALLFFVPGSAIHRYAKELDSAHIYSLGGVLRNWGCARGDGRECRDLGNMYYHGRGTEIDTRRAAALYSKACDARDMVGCTMLAFMYGQGKGVARDDSRSAVLYFEACEGGRATGCDNLGRRYLEGRGVAKDYLRAVNLLSRACDGGEGRACNRLGELYSAGTGVEMDTEKAKQLFAKACSMGNQIACGSIQNFTPASEAQLPKAH